PDAERVAVQPPRAHRTTCQNSTDLVRAASAATACSASRSPALRLPRASADHTISVPHRHNGPCTEPRPSGITRGTTGVDQEPRPSGITFPSTCLQHNGRSYHTDTTSTQHHERSYHTGTTGLGTPRDRHNRRLRSA